MQHSTLITLSMLLLLLLVPSSAKKSHGKNRGGGTQGRRGPQPPAPPPSGHRPSADSARRNQQQETPRNQPPATDSSKGTSLKTRAKAAAEAAVNKFEGRVNQGVNDSSQRLWPVCTTGGAVSKEQRAPKPCRRPYNALQYFGDFPALRKHICHLQALIRFFANQLGFDMEIKECAANPDCRNDEVVLINKLFTDPSEANIIAYYNAKGLALNTGHNYQYVFGNALAYLGRKDPYDSSSRNQLGNKYMVRVRYFVKVSLQTELMVLVQRLSTRPI